MGCGASTEREGGGAAADPAPPDWRQRLEAAEKALADARAEKQAILEAAEKLRVAAEARTAASAKRLEAAEQALANAEQKRRLSQLYRDHLRSQLPDCAPDTLDDAAGFVGKPHVLRVGPMVLKFAVTADKIKELRGDFDRHQTAALRFPMLVPPVRGYAEHVPSGADAPVAACMAVGFEPGCTLGDLFRVALPSKLVVEHARAACGELYGALPASLRPKDQHEDNIMVRSDGTLLAFDFGDPVSRSTPSDGSDEGNAAAAAAPEAPDRVLTMAMVGFFDEVPQQKPNQTSESQEDSRRAWEAFLAEHHGTAVALTASKWQDASAGFHGKRLRRGRKQRASAPPPPASLTLRRWYPAVVKFGCPLDVLDGAAHLARLERLAEAGALLSRSPAVQQLVLTLLAEGTATAAALSCLLPAAASVATEAASPHQHAALHDCGTARAVARKWLLGRWRDDDDGAQREAAPQVFMAVRKMLAPELSDLPSPAAYLESVSAFLHRLEFLRLPDDVGADAMCTISFTHVIINVDVDHGSRLDVVLALRVLHEYGHFARAWFRAAAGLPMTRTPPAVVPTAAPPTRKMHRDERELSPSSDDSSAEAGHRLVKLLAGACSASDDPAALSKWSSWDGLAPLKPSSSPELTKRRAHFSAAANEVWAADSEAADDYDAAGELVSDTPAS